MLMVMQADRAAPATVLTTGLLRIVMAPSTFRIAHGRSVQAETLPIIILSDSTISQHILTVRIVLERTHLQPRARQWAPQAGQSDSSCGMQHTQQAKLRTAVTWSAPHATPCTTRETLPTVRHSCG